MQTGHHYQGIAALSPPGGGGAVFSLPKATVAVAGNRENTAGFLSQRSGGRGDCAEWCWYSRQHVSWLKPPMALLFPARLPHIEVLDQGASASQPDTVPCPPEGRPEPPELAVISASSCLLPPSIHPEPGGHSSTTAVPS